MSLDILAVFFVTLISSLFLCTTSVHGLPKLPSAHHLTHHHPSADSSSPLRPVHQQPIPSVDYDLGGDTSAMFTGESNEFSAVKDDDDNDDDLSATSLTSSSHASHVPFDFYLHQLPSKLLSRKFLSSPSRQHQQHDEDKQHKRASLPAISAPPTLPKEFNFNSAAAAAALADASDPNGVLNLDRLSDSARLSPSLKVLVETNPFARAWLTVLLKKVMEEQPAPYIFKYGRRRKK